MSDLYRATVPLFTRGFAVMATELTVAADFAASHGISPDILISARLAPDMLTLGQQVQRASDTSKNAVMRLTGLKVPTFPDSEVTFGELQMRIASTITFLSSVDSTHFQHAAQRSISLNFSKIKVEMTGEDYLYQFVLPNFFFHLATVHNILRHKGLPLGKADYLGFNN